MGLRGRVPETEARASRARDEQKPVRPAQTKDRNRDHGASVEGIESDVSMGPSDQDAVEQARIINDRSARPK